MALRHLQLLRNSGITQTRESALSTATGKTTNLKDGDVIVARYLISGGSAAEGNVAVAVGHKVGGENGGYIVWNDNQQLKELISASTASTENLEKAVGVAHNASAITFGETNYIGTSGSASGALVTLDTQLKTTDDLAKQVQAAVGSSASTLNIESGNYVASSDTVKQAVTKLDTNLYTVSGKTDSGITAFNNYTTQVVGRASGLTGVGVSGSNFESGDTVISAITKLDKAIESGDTATDNLRKAVGAAEGASAMTYADSTKYIKNDTTVKAALETLDTNLNTVSGDLDTLESTYALYTAATDANTAATRTMASNLDTVVGVTSAATTLGVENAHYVESDDSVKDAIVALDTQLYEVSSGATEDLNALRAAVGVTSGQSAITITGAHYATGSTTVVTALTDIDEQLYSATTSVDKAHQFLGTQSGDSRFNASGKYVSAATTVTSAATALNDAIVANDTNDANLRAVVGVNSGDTTLTIPNPSFVGQTPQVSGAIKTLDTVEKATRDTIGGMNAEGTSGLALTGQHYISGDPTVVSALTDLDTNLYELSGKATSNTILAQNPISSQTIADSGTTVGLKLDAVITDTAVTSSAETEMHKNILAVSENGLYALADLHYDATLNKLTYVNTNGKKDIQLTGVKVFDEVTYISSAETIDLSYTDLSGGTKHVYIPVGDIIEEYSFQPSETPAEQQASSEHHNVSLVRDRHVSGATEVYGEISVFDCGEY